MVKQWNMFIEQYKVFFTLNQQTQTIDTNLNISQPH